MKHTPSRDVIVIGAGLVGAATALGLAEAGFRVSLCEGMFAGGGSSGAAMGHLVVMDDTPAQFALCAHSCARWRELAPQLPADCEIDYCGTIWLATNADELASAAPRVAAYGARGIPAELLDEAALRRKEPALRAGLAGGLHVPGDGVCYPPAVARALVARAEACGAEVLSGNSVQRVGSGEVILADGTRLVAGTIVVAAGIASPSLIPRLPVIPRKGHLVITDRRPGLVHSQVLELGYLASAHSFSGASIAFNVQPRRSGQMLIGSSRELVGTDASMNRPLVRAMLDRAGEFIPAIRSARALRSWTGFRPATPDKLPLIGPWPELPGVWVATGHEGLGITMSLGTADLVVAGMTGSTPPVDPAPFLPERPMPAIDLTAA